MMTLAEMLQTIARNRGLAVGLVYDPTAPEGEQWTATVGLDASGVSTHPAGALGAALLDLDQPDREPFVLFA